MRITFVIPFASLSGGIRVVAIYARHLEQMGHEVWVISKPHPRPPWRKQLNRLFGGNEAEPARQTPLLDFLGDRHVILDRDRDVTDADIPDGDVVFATWWATAPAVAALQASKGVKFYLLQDYEAFEGQPVDEVAATYQLPLHKLAVSDYIADTVRTRHGGSEIGVVPNTVDTELFETLPRSKNTSLTVGFLYNPVPRKRVRLAIEAVTQAKVDIPDLKVVAFGAASIKAAAPMPDWISYQRAPAEADIPKLYAQCDLWLFTSEKEGFGLPLLEAMASRTPVLATHAGAAPNLIDGTNGVLLDANADAFVTTLKHFAQMGDAEWQAYSDAAYNRVQGYSWSDATELLLEKVKMHMARSAS